MTKDLKAPSPELLALFALDRAELAVQLFVAALTPKLDAVYPAVGGIELGEALGVIGAVKLPKYTWDYSRQPEAGLVRLILELVLRWEAAGLAARGLGRERTEVVLLVSGESVLRAVDPEAAVRAALREAKP